MKIHNVHDMNVTIVCRDIKVFIHYIFNGEIPLQVYHWDENANFTDCFVFTRQKFQKCYCHSVIRTNNCVVMLCIQANMFKNQRICDKHLMLIM